MTRTLSTPLILGHPLYTYMQEVVSPEDIQLSDDSGEEADVDVEVQDGVDSDELHVDEVVVLEENSTDDKDEIVESVIETDAHLSVLV